jgi:NAD+ synthase (glutamine-hydrolysing)
MEAIRVAGASVNQIPLDWKHNVSNIIDAVNAARKQQVRILCFPELCITGYGCEDWFLSEWVPARALNELQSIRPHCVGITVCVGLPLVFEGNVYNGVCVISDTRILGITCKQFLARDGVHYEPRWFSPWPAGKVVSYGVDGFDVPFGDVMYEVEGIRIGFEICEDGWHKTSRPGYRFIEDAFYI